MWHFKIHQPSMCALSMFSENIYHQKPTLQPPLRDQGGLHAHKHNITASDEHAAVQAVVAIMDGDMCVKSDPKTHGSLELFMFLRLTGPPKCPYIQENDSCTRVLF